MAGRIKKLIDEIMERRSRGNPVIRSTTEVKLILRGVDPARFNATSPDDPDIEQKVRLIAQELGVPL
ncbi:MAG: hypothetical protein AB2A00_14750 [Myxococcota bacterium]